MNLETVFNSCKHYRDKEVECIYIRLGAHVERINLVDFQGYRSEVIIYKFGNNLVP